MALSVSLLRRYLEAVFETPFNGCFEIGRMGFDLSFKEESFVESFTLTEVLEQIAFFGRKATLPAWPLCMVTLAYLITE
jgi:hypothetical protein